MDAIIAPTNRGSADPVDLTINQRAGKIANKNVKNTASLLPTNSLISLWKK